MGAGCDGTPVCAGVRMLRRLAAESESSDDDTLARAVLLHQIREKAAALADELEETAARMIVLGEATEMAGQFLDPLGEERDLDFRGPGVTFLGGKPGDDLLLLFPRERHSFLRTRRYVAIPFFDRRMLAACGRTGKRGDLRRGRRVPSARHAVGGWRASPWSRTVGRCRVSTASTPGPATRA